MILNDTKWNIKFSSPISNVLGYKLRGTHILSRLKIIPISLGMGPVKWFEDRFLPPPKLWSDAIIMLFEELFSRKNVGDDLSWSCTLIAEELKVVTILSIIYHENLLGFESLLICFVNKS